MLRIKTLFAHPRPHLPLFCIGIIIATISAGWLLVMEGDYYLEKGVVALAFIVFVTAGNLIIAKVGVRTSWLPEKVFLSLFVPLALFSLIAIPPFSTPDSYEQFLRAYEISHGKFVSSIAFVDDAVSGNFHYRSGYIYNDAELLPVEMNRSNELRDVFHSIDATINHGNQEAYPYSTQATYSPIAFLFPAAGIGFMGLFTDNVWAIVYSGRLFTLVFCGLLLYLSIRSIPIGKTALSLLALSPLTVELYASMSPDAMTIALSFFFFSYVVRAIVEKGTVSIILLLLLMISIALGKIVYLPLCLLVFLIPNACFNHHQVLIKGLLFIVSLAVNLCWLLVATSCLIEYNEGVDAAAQLAYIFENPSLYIITVLTTLLQNGGDLVMQVFGSSLNWLNAKPPLTLPLILLAVFILHCGRNRNSDSFREEFKNERISAGLIALVTIIAIVSSIYVQWNPVGSSLINGLQGRYFIPVLPLLLFFFSLLGKEEGSSSLWLCWFSITCLALIAALEVAL